MCGICGIIYSDHERPVDRQTLARMADILRQRGPDSDGLYAEPGVGLTMEQFTIFRNFVRNSWHLAIAFVQA